MQIEIKMELKDDHLIIKVIQGDWVIATSVLSLKELKKVLENIES